MGGCEVRAVLDLGFQGQWVCQPFDLNAAKTAPNVFTYVAGSVTSPCCNTPNLEMAAESF